MLIPPRDWLLLRGRMRAAAKIAVLPALLEALAMEELRKAREGASRSELDRFAESG